MGMIKLPKRSVDFFKDHIDEIFESGILAEGPWNKRLSEYIMKMTGAVKSVPTNSNGAGIIALLLIYRHYFSRDHVMIQSNTMCGVRTMVPSSGCNLAGFIPCQLQTLMPGIMDVKKAIKKFSAEEKKRMIILLSHIGGIINPDIEQIADLCKEEKIVLIEDCAHSFGATLKGRHSGLFGEAGVYSFYSTKAIPAGEGGMIVTKDEETGSLCSDFSIYDRFKQKMEIGFNNRISEPQALLAYSVVREWETILKNKQEIAKKYIPTCNHLGIKFISQDGPDRTGNYYKFTIYNEEKKISEYLPLLKTKTSPVYDYAIGVPNPLANYHACLPIWFGQEESVTDRVISELQSCFR
jgi:dTDP-4-amino-4,6-dideoxygalactose transaminase